MTGDHRITPGPIGDVLSALDRHGYVHDHLHTGRAIVLIGDLARIGEGTQDYRVGARLIEVPSSLPATPGPSGQASHVGLEAGP